MPNGRSMLSLRWSQHLAYPAIGLLSLVFIGLIAPATLTYVRRSQGLLELKRQLEQIPDREISATDLLNPSLYRALATDTTSSRGGAPDIALILDAPRCAQCSAAFPDWLTVAERNFTGREVEAWILVPPGANSSALANGLANKGAALRLLTPVDPRTFGVRTGLRGAPMAVVIRGGTVACAFQGKPRAEALLACRDNLHQTKLTTLVFFGSEMIPFILPSTMVSKVQDNP